MINMLARSFYGRLTLGAVVLQAKSRIAPGRFKRFFKLPHFLVNYVYEKLVASFACDPIHLLWTLHYLKSKNPLDEEIAKLMNSSKESFMFHVLTTLQNLDKALPNVCPSAPQFLVFSCSVQSFSILHSYSNISSLTVMIILFIFPLIISTSIFVTANMCSLILQGLKDGSSKAHHVLWTQHL